MNTAHTSVSDTSLLLFNIMTSPAFIETQEQLDLALQQWRNFSFKDKYIKLEDAANSILSEDRTLEARRQFAAKWLVSELWH